MTDQDYPALYRAADRASASAQLKLLRTLKIYVLLSIVGAALAAYGIDNVDVAVVAALVFLAALFVSIFLAVSQFEALWYRARAVAESIKTSVWRFMMCAEPFEAVVQMAEARAQFRALLHKILTEHRDLAHDLGGTIAAEDQITETMRLTRESTLGARKTTYREKRIQEQRSWYARKSRYNRNWGRFWFWALVVLQAGAVLLVVLRIEYPNYKHWFPEVFVVAAAGVLVWTQTKRFRELAAAYAVAAHEIGLANDQLDEVRSEDQFSKFVADTEGAFSREHTQWVARKDER